jgi:hypothetical protein
MLKRLPTDQLEEESRLALHQLVNSANHQNVSYSRDNFGIDGEVRLVHGIEHTGKGFKYQLKAGSSYISSENNEVVRVKVERKYVLLWHKMREPVVLIFYHPDTRILYWKAIQPFLKIYPELLKKETDKVIVPLNKVRDILDHSSFAALELVADGEFGYQKIIYSKDTSEVMVTNRFLVQELPSYVYVAPTQFEHRGQITSQLSQNHFYAFRIEPGKNGGHYLYTFSDLANPNVEIRKFCDNAGDKLSSSEITHIQYMALLNRLIFINAMQMDLAVDHDRFYFRFEVLKEDRNSFEYAGIKGGSEKRTKIYQRKNDLKHHAAKIRLVREAEVWYLEVDPDWHITITDNSEAGPREVGRRITKEKAATRNGDYRYALHFWSRYLSRNTSVIDFPCDSVGSGQKLRASADCLTLTSDYTLFNDYVGPRNAALQN